MHNTIVLVGGVDRLAEVALKAAFAASAARVVRADINNAATICAEERPYAILVAEEVYDFGGPEFDALGRDLHAGVVVAPDTVALAVLTAMFQEEAVRLG
ncbi:MAG: hypothetical protein IPG04_07495 [Polyangiaceae bacterium]|nr:hypothetical protein [Polyangiaceae bacterium]